jgi:hypothetical protein
MPPYYGIDMELQTTRCGATVMIFQTCKSVAYHGWVAGLVNTLDEVKGNALPWLHCTLSVSGLSFMEVIQ